ncbi:hypothetical protein ACIPD2_36335 [Streptomyces griseofuscus]|uniref:hypothetical protein n=1 Tax=Streptomyces griseofuscus TaxID=146922 RepID=UPI0037F6B3B3
MKWLQKWGRKSMTEGAIAAREQGDSTYVFRMASSAQQIQSRYIEVIESEGWKFVSLHEDQANPRRRWVLTFSRKEQAEETPQIPA